MIWDKQKIQLLFLLEEIEKLRPQSQPDTDLEVFLIKWMKVQRICNDRLKDSTLTSQQKSLPNSLIIKFKQNVHPILLNFSKEIKKKPLAPALSYFFSKITEYSNEGQEFLKTLPLKSYEIYEDALFFINLYQFLFDPNISRLAKQNIFKKIRLIKEAFEIEAGKENLEKEQEKLSTAISHSFKGISPSAPPAEVSSKDTGSDDISEGDIMIGNLSLPEEELVSKIEPIEEPTSDKIYESIPQPIDESYSQLISTQLTYPYIKWFPEQNWNNFAMYRYCYQCGMVIPCQCQKKEI